MGSISLSLNRSMSMKSMSFLLRANRVPRPPKRRKPTSRRTPAPCKSTPPDEQHFGRHDEADLALPRLAAHLRAEGDERGEVTAVLDIGWRGWALLSAMGRLNAY